MRKRVWVFQYGRDVKKNPDGASHFVGWYDLDGKRHSESCGPGDDGMARAESRKFEIQNELDELLYSGAGSRKWTDVRREYESVVLSELPDSSRVEIGRSLSAFELICQPQRMSDITPTMIDEFKRRRQYNNHKNPGGKVSPATVNKDLRCVRAMLNKAVEWGILSDAPRIRFLSEPPRQVRHRESGSEFADKPAMDLLLRALRCGAARFDCDTGDVMVGERAYETNGKRWSSVVGAIGWDVLRAAVRESSMQTIES